MEEKGFVLESDHPYAYAMQYSDAYDDVVEWLEQHDHIGELDKAGFFDGVAVYALYDELRISYKRNFSGIKKRSRATGSLDYVGYHEKYYKLHLSRSGESHWHYVFQ